MSSDRTTELINLMSAMAREVGEMRQEINTRFDRNEAEISTMRGEMNARFNNMDARFSRLQEDFKEVRYEVRHLRRERDSEQRQPEEIKERIEALDGKPW